MVGGVTEKNKEQFDHHLIWMDMNLPISGGFGCSSACFR